MKVVMICGSHPRHLYILNTLAALGVLAGIVMEKREPMILSVPENISPKTKELFVYHFNLRAKMEALYFGDPDINSIKKQIPVMEIEESQLNSPEVEKFILESHADVIISYGPGLIKDNILATVHGKALNIHGGLSPYYKGSAAMFWPFYFLEPNYVGTTIHYIAKKIDAGNIIHQSVPQLSRGDCMHEVACKALVQTAKDLPMVIDSLKSGVVTGVPQKKNGKLFLEKDWRPEHLHLIYELYEDKIVDLYLDGKINQNNEPTLIRIA